MFDGLDNHLTATGDDALTIDVICKNLNHQYKKMKKRRKSKKKRPLVPTINSINSDAGNIISMATNLEIRNILKMKMKMKMKKKIRNIKKDYGNRKFDGVCYHCSRKGHMSNWR